MCTVFDKDFLLSSNEKILLKLCKEKLEGYSSSEHEQIQKENELFYLLSYFSSFNKLNLIDNIVPNEPGDFVLELNDKKMIIEVVECYGSSGTYIEMKNRINTIFNRKNQRIAVGEYKFDEKNFVKQFKKMLIEKNSKLYLDSDFDIKILLIVTGEFDNCANTGSWFMKYLSSSDFDVNRYDNIWIVDYFANGMDNGPIFHTNTINDVKEYEELMNY